MLAEEISFRTGLRSSAVKNQTQIHQRSIPVSLYVMMSYESRKLTLSGGGEKPLRLQSIQARNFLSLRHVRVDKLDEHLNFFVGPNGSGKTSVFRVIRAIRDMFDAFAQGGTVQNIAKLCTRGVTAADIDLALHVVFDQPEEQDLLVTFLCAALSNPGDLRNVTIERNPSPAEVEEQSTPREVIPITRPTEEGISQFSEMLATLLGPESVPFFFEGDLRITYRMGQVYPFMRLSYTFQCADTAMTIVTGNGFTSGQLCLGDPPPQTQGSFSVGHAWITVFEAAHKLKGFASFISGQEMIGPALSARALLTGLATLNVELSVRLEQPFLRAHTRMIELLGIQQSELSQTVTFARLISRLLHRSMVFTYNQRMPVERFTPFSREDLDTKLLSLDDETKVPLFLYRLKVGTFAERKRFERIQDTFAELVGGNQRFDLEVTKIPESGGGGLEIDLRVVDQEGDISLTYQGAGFWEALFLATLLETSTGHILLLDEPAANLHPGMQHKLMELLREASGQVFVITHSSHLLPTRADDFRRVRRLQKKGMETEVRGLDDVPVGPDEEKLEQKLIASSDMAGLLFAHGVILVEGALTELPAMSQWFPQSRVGKERSLADLNIALYPVIGAGNFALYLRFLQAFGVKWVVICDSDALEPGTRHGRPLWKALHELDVVKRVPEGNPFEEVRAQAEQVGVYTANNQPGQKFEHIPDVARYMVEQGLTPKSKADGREVGQALRCPQEFEHIFACALAHLGMT